MIFTKAIIKAAKQVVEQWDNHDKYRETEADQALSDPELGEPTDVAIARAVVKRNVADEKIREYLSWGGETYDQRRVRVLNNG